MTSQEACEYLNNRPYKLGRLDYQATKVLLNSYAELVVKVAQLESLT